VLLILLCMLSALLWKLCKSFYFFFLPSHLHQSYFRGVAIIAIQKDLGLHRLLHFCNCKLLSVVEFLKFESYLSRMLQTPLMYLARHDGSSLS
jgi:hypothetical protein